MRASIVPAPLDGHVGARTFAMLTWSLDSVGGTCCSGTDIRTVQEMPGHGGVSTATIYTHVLTPLDAIFAG